MPKLRRRGWERWLERSWGLAGEPQTGGSGYGMGGREHTFMVAGQNQRQALLKAGLLVASRACRGTGTWLHEMSNDLLGKL